jgi:hypothetical protein
MTQQENTTQQITLYHQAKTILAEYKSVDEVKDFRDKAVAIEAYAKQANDMELEWDAARARVRAERKCGELLSQLEKARGGDRKSISAPVEIDSEYKRACDRASINKDQAANFQKLAAVPEAEFEKAIDNPAAKPSTNHIIKPREPEPKRMDKDALFVWGTLRDFRSKGILEIDLKFIVSEWTDAMKQDAESIIPKLKEWINNYD